MTDQYIAETVKETTKQRTRIRKECEKEDGISRRKFTRNYFLTTDENQSIEICQAMYLQTFDLTLKKVRIIVEKKRASQSNICPMDGRGKHFKHSKIQTDRKDVIRKHINSFPAYNSHYSRERTSKKYLSPDLSVAEIYRLYCKYCRNNNINHEKESMYRKIFNEDFNLSFHSPANDTCAKCDQFNVSLRSMESKQLTKEEEDEQGKLLMEREKHLDLAETAYKQKSRGSTRNRKNEMEIEQPEPINSEPLPLADIKVKDLLGLLPYISKYNRPFYQNLKKSNDIDADIIPVPDIND
ncbi:unnamed protein product [Diabrotica balteata]|uniref:Uncharacterized protein n=1 Tax=Diabrotica balteata TaxID=107213 RepID=A0A9N9TBI5_DIABA|nr:unnamed protein product [Diabrotica balteata]